jgi:quinol monooxygenase YgiN
MIMSSIKICVVPEKRETVLEILYSLLEPIRVVPGCIACNLYQDMENENMLFYSEMWQNQEALDKHILSDSYRSILSVMDMSSEPPEIDFKTVTNLSGIETIAGLRRDLN